MASPRDGEKCNAPMARGLCKLPAGWGTEHPGVGCCKLHSPLSPANVKTDHVAQVNRHRGPRAR